MSSSCLIFLSKSTWTTMSVSSYPWKCPQWPLEQDEWGVIENAHDYLKYKVPFASENTVNAKAMHGVNLQEALGRAQLIINSRIYYINSLLIRFYSSIFFIQDINPFMSFLFYFFCPITDYHTADDTGIYTPESYLLDFNTLILDFNALPNWLLI